MSNQKQSDAQSQGNWIADGALMISACMWGINIPVVKHATESIDPLVFNAARIVLSAIALGVLALLEQRVRRKTLQPFSWSRVIAFSACSGLIYALLFMFGIRRTTAANAALLMATMPMWTAFLSMLFLNERLKRITWIGLGITILGTIVVVSAKGQIDFSIKLLAGNLLILSASMVWATATVLSRPLMEPVGPLRLAFLSCAMTTPIQWMIASHWMMEQWPQLFEPNMLGCLLYSGLLSTGLAYATWNFGVQRLGGSHASVYQNVVTLVAVLGGWLALGETAYAAQVLGGILMIAGLLMMRWGRD